MSNPFADQPWETSSVTDILPAGDHVVTISAVEDGTSSGGHPQLEVKAGNDEGVITDWIVVIPTALWRATSLFAACGLEKPADGQVKEEGTGYRIDPAYFGQCVGKQVGVLVRQEPDRNDPTRMRDRVKGWVTVEEITAAHTDAPADGFKDPVPAGAGKVADDDIPF
jgi:hypothetical protein